MEETEKPGDRAGYNCMEPVLSLMDDDTHLGDFIEEPDMESPIDMSTIEGLKEANLEILETFTPKKSQGLPSQHMLEGNLPFFRQQVPENPTPDLAQAKYTDGITPK